MKRKHKTYSKPKRPFDKARIEEEAKIMEEFGLKNKREIWKADARIKEMREKAKKLISADAESQKKLFERLKKMGFNVNSIGNVLSLDKKDYLRRRLQTVLLDKRLAKSAKGARQLIVHRKALVDGKAIDSPSYIVPIELEDKIIIKMKKGKPKEKPAKTGEEEKENEGSS
jgi:small subunit ribosomal protein S4